MPTLESPLIEHLFMVNDFPPLISPVVKINHVGGVLQISSHIGILIGDDGRVQHVAMILSILSWIVEYE